MKQFDVVVIGSGFGGSVTALRLTEKGYSVGILEAGKRFEDADFPKTSWRLNKFLFAPKLGLHGIQRIHFLPDVLVLCGAGVGGGSLVYANTLYQPGDKYFQDPQWAAITDWKSELTPWYDQARRMLGVIENPFFSNSDAAMQHAADEMGVGHTFKMAPLGIYFGEGPGIKKADPYFGGKGPARTGCTNCGECMTGCRHNAKNTLPKNYLGLAEKAGAEVFPRTTVNEFWQREDGKWIIRAGRQEFLAKELVVAAGTFNTQKLLHKMKAKGHLSKISDRLGELSRTNSEALTGALMDSKKIDFSEGSAITSSFFPDEHTHIQPVRYGKGSNAMGLLQTIMTDSYSPKERRRQWWKIFLKNPKILARLLNVRAWSEKTVIALIMQDVDSSITVKGKRGLFGFRLTSKNSSDQPNATYIPAANESVRHIAKKYGGITGGHVGDLIGAPFTAHFVGGCVIGESDATGVIDPYHRVWNYPTLHVVDGSTITANLGVNPSLTITAQAERAMSMWPNKNQPDLRPEQGAGYKQVIAVAPTHPVVPKGAIGELLTSQ
jgi:cholesterol oxidase